MNKHWVLGLIAVATLAGCNRSSEVPFCQLYCPYS